MSQQAVGVAVGRHSLIERGKAALETQESSSRLAGRQRRTFQNVDLCVAARLFVSQRRLTKPAVGVSFRRTTNAIRNDLSVLGAFGQMLFIRELCMSNLLHFFLFFFQTWIIVGSISANIKH